MCVYGNFMFSLHVPSRYTETVLHFLKTFVLFECELYMYSVNVNKLP